MSSLRFQLLGPVAAYGEQGPVSVGPARQRTVLAVLLAELGRLVAFDLLVGKVWGEAPPQRARETLHTYLSRLRAVLDDAHGPRLVRRANGYSLEADPDTVDLYRFRALADQARRAADDHRAARLWGDALTLWRGTPFADLDSDWLRRLAVALEGERLAAVLEHNEVLLRRGEHARLLPALTTAVTEHPLDERLAGQLMLALYRCGRQGDALALYRRLHERLVDELGSDPGPALRDLQRRILQHDPGLAPPIEACGAGEPPIHDRTHPHRPAQLLADVAGFTGRDTELHRLDALLDGTDDHARPVVIMAIGGTAGVGKTALAVHWAHRVADRFPDGQLYVNLHGYDPQQPMPAADALARFLAALGVTGQNIPVDLDERAARYRSELAGRRMLIVLDNAASVAQVRPLLPGSGTCLVVVTSRDSLAGLVAVHGAHRIDLDLLSPDEAVGLLHRLIGARVGAEPAAARTLAEQCARLPLALRIAAELAASRPETSLADLAAELADRRARLELLDAGGDPYATVREVFSWSIQQLPAEAVRAFRLLGLHPGPDMAAYAVAALLETGIHQAQRVLELLARAHLVHRTERDRYGIHDLLRAYASHLATTEETDEHRQRAEARLRLYYQAAATSAMDTLHPNEAHWRPSRPESTTALPDLTDPNAASGWLESERFCLVAMAAQAAAQGNARYAVDLARVLYRYFSAAHLTEQLAINGHALRAAEQAGDLLGTAHAQRHLATVYVSSGRYAQATEHGELARTLFRDAGDRTGEGLALIALGVGQGRMGNHQQAIDCYREAIVCFREVGDLLGEASGLVNLAIVNTSLARYAQAATDHRRALALYREIGSLYHEGLTLGSLADVELRQGEYAAAGQNFRRALDIVRHLDIPITEASILDGLGRLHLQLREPETATGYLRRALELCRATGERYGQSWTLNSLGEAAQLADRPKEAIAHHTEALAIATETGSRQQQARARAGLGKAYRTLGDADQAKAQYEQAYAIYTELDMPDADKVRAALVRLDAG